MRSLAYCLSLQIDLVRVPRKVFAAVPVIDEFPIRRLADIFRVILIQPVRVGLPLRIVDAVDAAFVRWFGLVNGFRIAHDAVLLPYIRLFYAIIPHFIISVNVKAWYKVLQITISPPISSDARTPYFMRFFSTC